MKIRSMFLVLAGVLCLCLFAASASAQAHPTATGPGAFLSAGGGVSAFRADYTQRTIAGGYVFADVHWRSRYSLEGEARWLRFHTDLGVTETNYLIGPRVEFLRKGRLRPYGKFLVGSGRIRFPFGLENGSYLALAPGVGLGIRLTDRITLRPVDFEYQAWPGFTYGKMHPYGLSMGVSIRLTRANLFKNDPYVY